MHLHEIDWRIAPLHDVFVGLDAGLAKIRQRFETEEAFDDVHWRAEQLFGLGFVAAQTYALGTVKDLDHVRISRHKPSKEKHEWYEQDLITLKGGVNRIQLINASANYFKHHDEWKGWPSNHTTNTFSAVGVTKTTEFPCTHTFELLCGTSWDLILLHQIMKEWRAHLFGNYL